MSKPNLNAINQEIAKLNFDNGKTDQTQYNNDAERGWIQTFTGKKFFPLNPSEEQICIEDIAHGLSLTCRFTGQCRRFYSVAEHCLRAITVLEDPMLGIDSPILKLWMLLHDAGEAYLLDLAKPVKQLLPQFEEAEDKIMRCVCQKFGLPFEMPPLVKTIDQFMLSIEARDLFSSLLPGWEIWEQKMRADHILSHLYDSYTVNDNQFKGPIKGHPEYAEHLFVAKFRELHCQAREQNILLS